jgi:DNA-directed RNA polymerase specialized sigma24 family protein
MSTSAYTRHRVRLTALAIARGCAAHEAEDLVQDIFATLIRVNRLDALDALPAPDQSALLIRRLRSQLINSRRNRHRHRHDTRCTIALSDVEDIASLTNPASEHDHAWALAQIDEALLRLRCELTHCQWQSVEPRLCGDCTATASSKLRVAVHRARKRLRSMIPREELYPALLHAAM